MPHPGYALDRDLSALLARSPDSARYLTRWYGSGNGAEAVSALRQAATQALRRVGEDGPTIEQREELGRLLADLAALK